MMRRTKRSPNERRFKCEQCERMFFTRKDVKRHLVVHTGIRNYACPFCQQRFGRKDHLVRHAKKSHHKDARNLVTNVSGISSVVRRIPFGNSSHSPSSQTLSSREVVSRSYSNLDNVNNSPSHYLTLNSSLESSLMLLSNSGHLNNNDYLSDTNTMTINEGICSPSVAHTQLCENQLYNGPHYFGLGQTTPSIMNSTYLTNCFGQISMNSNAIQNIGVPSCDQNSPVSFSNSISMDSVSNPLPHFNQVFQ